MFSTITSAALCGMEAVAIHAEVDIAHGLPGLVMVGHLGSEVKEAGERVRVALKNMGIPIPPMRITVNLSPANIRKEGTAYDLPVAVGILCAMGYVLPQNIGQIMIVGELSLNGEVNPVRGILPMIRKAKELGMTKCLVPEANSREGNFVEGIETVGVRNLAEAIDFLKNGKKKPEENKNIRTPENGKRTDFREIKGQAAAKRAAEIAAAGFHHLLLIGPPGGGKTMIAERISGILPPLTKEESLEVSSVYSISGLLNDGQALIDRRPFVHPHHTITAQALAGGGRIAKPGMISLAHKGVLFLDELPEFKPDVIDLLRQPLEEKNIRIARVGGNYTFPAEFMLVGAMNPCPCGNYPDVGKCRCTPKSISRYQNRISGPVLDRIDICAEVGRLSVGELIDKKARAGEESSEIIRNRVMKARKVQEERYRKKEFSFNAMLPAEELEAFCGLGEEEKKFLRKAAGTIKISARGYHRTLRVARTIADLDESEKVTCFHLAEALECRMSAERYWQK